MDCPACDCLPYHAVFQAVKPGGLGAADVRQRIFFAIVISCVIRVSDG